VTSVSFCNSVNFCTISPYRLGSMPQFSLSHRVSQNGRNRQARNFERTACVDPAVMAEWIRLSFEVPCTGARAEEIRTTPGAYNEFWFEFWPFKRTRPHLDMPNSSLNCGDILKGLLVPPVRCVYILPSLWMDLAAHLDAAGVVRPRWDWLRKRRRPREGNARWLLNCRYDALWSFPPLESRRPR
jgi:hypothetical protein